MKITAALFLVLIFSNSTLAATCQDRLFKIVEADKEALFTQTIIKNTIPHRAPFLFVDRVIKLEKVDGAGLTPGDAIEAEWDIHKDLPFYAGHYPGNPVTPGVLVEESLNQAATFLALYGMDWGDQVPVLVGSGEKRLINPIVPNTDGSISRVNLKVTYKGEENGVHLFEGIARTPDNKFAARVRGIMGKMVPRSHLKNSSK